MSKKRLLSLIGLGLSCALIPSLQAQNNVGINDDNTAPNASAMLDVKSTNKGLLIPRLTALQRNGIVTPATGLLIYQTDATPGFYYNSGTPATPTWTRLVTPNVAWGLTGNVGTDASINFIGTLDNQGLRIRTNNTNRAFFSPTTNYFAVGPSNAETWNQIEVSNNVANGYAGMIINAAGGGTSQAGLAFYTSTAANDAMIFMDQGDGDKLKFAMGDIFSNRLANTRMTLTQAGFLGIGVTAPTTNLDVNGTVRIRGGAPAAGRVLTCDATGLASWQPAAGGSDNLGNHVITQPLTTTLGNGNIIQIGDDAHIADANIGDHIMVRGIQSGGVNGGVLLGDVGANRVRITGNASTPNTWAGEGFSGTGIYMGWGRAEEGGFYADGNYAAVISPGDNDLVKFIDEDFFDNAGTIFDNNATRARIDGNGQYFQISDAKAKHNIQPLSNSLAKIMAIGGYSYLYNLAPAEIEKGDKPTPSVGVLAHELEKVLPEAVSNKDGGYMVNYSAITPLLIEAVKELKQENDALRAEMQALREETRQLLDELKKKH